MLRYKTALFATAFLAAGSVAVADQWNKKTVLTVGETIMVPGATLAPGKYVIKLVDSLADRHIVQITNERENHVYTTILAIPNYRIKPKENTAFGWWETPRGNPPAIRAWFYPGDNFGQEFAYPKGLSAKFAQAAQQPVPTAAPVETPAAMKTAPLTIVEPSGKEAPLVVQAPPPAPAARQPEVIAQARPPAAEPAPAPAVAPQPEPEPAARQMPATASPFAALGAAGLVALAAGLALRAAIRRTA